MLLVLLIGCLVTGLKLGWRSGPVDMRDPTSGQPLDPEALETDEPRGLPASAYPGQRRYAASTPHAFGPPAPHDYIGSVAKDETEADSKDD